MELERIHGAINLRAHRDGMRVLRTIRSELRSPHRAAAERSVVALVADPA